MNSMNFDEYPEMLDITLLARMFDRSKNTIWMWIKQGKLPPAKVRCSQQTKWWSKQEVLEYVMRGDKVI